MARPAHRSGLRVTDADTLDIARMVLMGKVNRDIGSATNVHGPLAVGMSGEDANLITAAQIAQRWDSWAVWLRSTPPCCNA
jgi:acetylglutamate kinase